METAYLRGGMSPSGGTLDFIENSGTVGQDPTTKRTASQSKPSTSIDSNSERANHAGVTREEHICLLIIIYNSTLVSRCVGAVYHLPPVFVRSRPGLPGLHTTQYLLHRPRCPILAHVFWQKHQRRTTKTTVFVYALHIYVDRRHFKNGFGRSNFMISKKRYRVL